jgi:hypothetical protein
MSLYLLSGDSSLLPQVSLCCSATDRIKRGEATRLDKETSMGVDISLDGLIVRCPFDSAFGSVRANRVLTEGKYYYEVTLITSGLFQIGWTTKEITGDNNVCYVLFCISLAKN